MFSPKQEENSWDVLLSKSWRNSDKCGAGEAGFGAGAQPGYQVWAEGPPAVSRCWALAFSSREGLGSWLEDRAEGAAACSAPLHTPLCCSCWVREGQGKMHVPPCTAIPASLSHWLHCRIKAVAPPAENQWGTTILSDLLGLFFFSFFAWRNISPAVVEDNHRWCFVTGTRVKHSLF